MRNIIITGGELFNKGAQAMVFIAVDELKKRYPKHEIYVLSELDLHRPKSEKEIYAFNFTGWYPIKFAKAQSNWVLKQICKIKNSNEYYQAYNLYSNCDLMIDISGYALGSNWGYDTCSLFLDHIEFAHAFDIPLYLMPQSFGPFEFNDEYSAELTERIASLLPTAKIICAREEECALSLKKHYDLNNIIIKNDLVLNNKSVNLESIYIQEPKCDLPKIEQNSVGIVPSEMIVKSFGRENILVYYEKIINYLLSNNFNVYIVSHAASDIELCKSIKSLFPDNNKVILIDKDLSCVFFGQIVSKMKFIIASRFHAIVHAYKNSVPCISIGWAEKYSALLKKFNQDKFAFDVRENISVKDILEIINDLLNCLDEEKTIISEQLKLYQKENVFDILPDKI